MDLYDLRFVVIHTHIYIYTFVFVCLYCSAIYGLPCDVLSPSDLFSATGRYLYSTVDRYCTRYAKHTQYIDKYWTSCWSPIRSR